MKKYKTAELFLVLLVLIVMSAGILILQNGMEKLQSVQQESVYVPERRDLYNNYGLKNGQSLSKTKILETQDQVIYTDRIFNINRISEDRISYAADIMKALQEKSGKATYIMPIPERAAFESGYETEKERYSDFTEKLKASFSDPSVVLDPLSELENHQDEYIYFRTGNSWTMRGAFYGAQVIFGELGYDKENLDSYREYVFGTFRGNLFREALKKYSTDEIKKEIENMEKEPFYIYINGSNPNREELTLKNNEGQPQTVKRQTIQFNSSGNDAVIGSDFVHSIVEGRGKGQGKGNLLLIADARGKMMISYLSEIYDKVYVSNIYKDADLIQNLDEILKKYNIEYIIWAQDVAETGNRAYMKALNPLLKEGGVSDVGTDS
mgnify:FL=1